MKTERSAVGVQSLLI